MGISRLEIQRRCVRSSPMRPPKLQGHRGAGRGSARTPRDRGGAGSGRLTPDDDAASWLVGREPDLRAQRGCGGFALIEGPAPPRDTAPRQRPPGTCGRRSACLVLVDVLAGPRPARPCPRGDGTWHQQVFQGIEKMQSVGGR